MGDDCHHRISSAFGLQIYTSTPPLIFWGVLVALMVALLAVLARRLPLVS
jgi:hypothetical protein